MGESEPPLSRERVGEEAGWCAEFRCLPGVHPGPFLVFTPVWCVRNWQQLQPRGAEFPKPYRRSCPSSLGSRTTLSGAGRAGELLTGWVQLRRVSPVQELSSA